MNHLDYYQVLGVPPSASLEQIKAAYRRQAVRFHPDKNPGSDRAAEQFRRCSEAYAVLSDAARRAAYDNRIDGRSVPELARELLDDLLGTRLKRKRTGRDVHYDLALGFREAARGAKRRIQFSVSELCGHCRGSGAAPGGLTRCADCAGRGELKRRSLLSLSRACPRCGGRGTVVVKRCPECSGVGTVEAMRTYDVALPGDVKHGDTTVIAGEGEPGLNGGAAGDLHVRIQVREDPVLRRQGSDILVEVPIRFAAAAMGGAVDVPTIDGAVRMKVPPETQSGRTLRLRGRGVLRKDGSRGDQLVCLMVETPAELSTGQRRHLVAFDRACSAKTHPRELAYLDALQTEER